ncbi:glycosyltransferase family 4 protein [Pedobacter rhodius]|uniref:Glycosyltransferase family 4 protein n=1 Tax=Pedobacter rhodius TaxID=3004098 RepID=A0ABT4KSA1_9SPHI|nr:glycosyltransferase family 4 protein [Pedobacter sp. SJ11]MCZ4221790.1 glycosyltransferase family 4 protein [Pedobacter sp. SJ11]
MNKKLAIISTHPIQYYAPVFQLMAQQSELKVFYTLGSNFSSFDRGFNQYIEWDLPLLTGYAYEFIENTSKNPGTHHFKGIINPNLNEQIKIYKPDAILIYGWAYVSHLNLIRYFKGKIPIYFRGDSTLFSRSAKWKTFFKKPFLKWVYRHVDFAFYTGTANRAYFEKYGLKENQLAFAPHAIDNKRFFEDRHTEAESLRAKLGIRSDEVLVLFAGKFDVVKSPLILLRAFIELDLTNTHLLFVGSGPLELKLKAKSKKQKANHNRIHFMDFQNQTEMPVIYQSCDLFCLPSLSETWGLAVNEAMASSKAILVSDRVGCANDLVKQGKNGKIFNYMDFEDLKNKLAYLCSDRNLLSSYGTASKTLINSWSLDEQVKHLLQIITNEPKK